MADLTQPNVLRVTDFDVTLFDTVKGLEALADIAGRDLPGIEIHVDALHMMRTYSTFRESNRTFQPEDYFRYHGMSEDNIRTVYSQYAQLREPELLYPDARRYVERVNASPTDHLFIETTGHERPQRSKLGAAGLLGESVAIPVRVIRSHEKGKDINSWKNKRGVYVPPEAEIPACDTAVLVDDRRDVAEGMDPQSSQFYVIERPGVSRRGASIALPAGAMVVASLDEIPVPVPRVI